MLDEAWPHQVMVNAKVASGQNPAGQFCALHDLLVSSQHKSVRRDDRDYLVYCFKHPDDAELFTAQFNGELVPVTKRTSN